MRSQKGNMDSIFFYSDVWSCTFLVVAHSSAQTALSGNVWKSLESCEFVINPILLPYDCCRAGKILVVLPYNGGFINCCRCRKISNFKIFLPNLGLWLSFNKKPNHSPKIYHWICCIFPSYLDPLRHFVYLG